MFDFVEKIVYINLDHRVDREQMFKNQLAQMKIPDEKILRFSAIKHSKGPIGCVLSHIKVLELAIENGWENVLIFEDDATMIEDLMNRSIGLSTLETLVSGHNFDVIVLGSTETCYNKSSFKLHHCQTTTAYLVNKHYYSTLLKNFKEGVALLQEKYIPCLYAIDIYWKNLQKKDNWYVIIPSLFIQSPSYSDIENRQVDYTNFFS